MKKFLALMLACIMAFALVACNNSSGNNSTTPVDTSSPSVSPTDSASPSTPAENTFELALITDVGNIDDQSFNQGTYEGMVRFAEDNNLTYAYYRPSEDSTEARIEAIGTAIERGAKSVVLPGYMFGEAIALVQDLYKDINFLAIDVNPSADMTVPVSSNVACITFQEEQCGFAAGYAAVMDGYRNLGFLGGMAVPAVQRYGYGFVQGVDAAAAELGLSDVKVNYWYGQAFWPTDDIKIKMDGWYTGGTEIVFSCGGGILTSCLAAANEADGKVIGVDVDQASIDPRIVTSAYKDLGGATITGLTALYNNGGKWDATYAGQHLVLGAKEGTVGLPTADGSWRFETYTVASYEELVGKIVSGTIQISDAIDAAPQVSAITVDYQE